MTEAFSQMNWLAVLVATVAHFGLGGVWYMVLFPKQYRASLGKGEQPAQTPGPRFIVGPVVCSALNIATTTFLLRALGITTYGDALLLGALVGIGYLVPMTVNIAINPNFPRPFYYSLISGPMFTLGSLMSAAIIVAMS
ncbi:DUF1761 domain-containing protein [Archangium violaceum]|uniref:DUF1761 domain-containing protein n=1 Tax=Archangium violaceum Cb vi76 TaxID=1406225 RepID=A0A084SH78_9BACT|nr:DUF1761 domain-containing protein [Archangium violaceum]KFA87813.1 hypothetical protein Q664_45365 [Archangium violaceum Cb vi76]